MKTKTTLTSYLIYIGVLILLTGSCKKDKDNPALTTVPEVSTSMISSILNNSAMGGGSVASDGGSPVLARGVCWGSSQTPTIADAKTIDGSGTGNFSSTLTGLTTNTSYKVRAYATNANGTAYGNEVNFTTTNNPILAVGAIYGGGIVFYVDGT